MVIVRAYRRRIKGKVCRIKSHVRRTYGPTKVDMKASTNEKKEEYLEELRDKRARFRQLKKHPKTPFVLNISDHNHDQDIKTFRTLVEAKRYTNKMLKDWERKWVKNENYTKSFGKMALSESTAVCVQDLVTGKQYIASASNQWE